MFSVLMAVYAKERPDFLAQALASLVQQTRLPEEVVLVRDGALTPSLNEIIADFQLRLPMRVVSLDRNVGLAPALNEGLKVASQPWIMRFDSDDLCVPDRIRVQAQLAMSDQYDIIGSQVREFEVSPSDSVRSRSLPCHHAEIVQFCSRRNPLNHMTVCYRKELVVEVGGYPPVYLMEDYALWALLLRRGARAMNSPQSLVYARIGNGMHRRRGGFRYLRSEAAMQRHLVQLCYKTPVRALIDGFLRGIVFLAPVWARKLVYQNLLRTKNH